MCRLHCSHNFRNRTVVKTYVGWGRYLLIAYLLVERYRARTNIATWCRFVLTSDKARVVLLRNGFRSAFLLRRLRDGGQVGFGDHFVWLSGAVIGFQSGVLPGILCARLLVGSADVRR